MLQPAWRRGHDLLPGPSDSSDDIASNLCQIHHHGPSGPVPGRDRRERRVDDPHDSVAVARGTKSEIRPASGDAGSS